ncbi:MAG: alpha/beta hydrolase [Halobacteriota archaeon]|nr:alpha/beta hydrolase [Halobacteriota archaeon]
MEDISFESDGIKLSGCYCNSEKPREDKTKTICVAHGLPFEPKPIEEKGYPDLAAKLCKNGFTSLVFNFRGTSKFGGEFGFMGWADDLSNAITFLLEEKNVHPDRLIVMGFSAGAMVSCYQASRDGRIKGIVLCCCPDRLDLKEFELGLEMGRRIGTIKFEDKGKVLNEVDMISPLDWISKIKVPLLIVHGGKDPVASVQGARRLYELAETSKELCIVEEAGHQLRQSKEAMNLVVEWIKEF